MNQEEIQQAAREEAWVPKADIVKISTTNMRIDPTMTQKEETYQVVLDIIKNTTFYKAFLITADVPEIFMQQFWHIVTKIKEFIFYEFKLANKKCQFDVEVFRKALDICPRIQGKEFIVPSSEEELLTFLLGLGYKRELTHLPKMLIDHMHQPWRTLESIINKCLSGKTFSNDRLCQSRVAIIYGMFHKKNVDFAELIWEDFSYQIDNRQLKKGRREITPYPRFTKIIINHFLSIHKSIPKGLSFGLNTIKDNGVLSQIKFIRIREDVQEYGKAIPNTMLTDAIKQLEAYKSFIGYSTGLVPPMKTTDVAFKLEKSISKTDAEIADETRRVHETHARLVTEKAASEEASEESGGELAHKVTGKRRTQGVTIRDTLRVSKKKLIDQSQKLNEIQTLTAEEQLATEMMQALKANKKSSRSQSHTGGSSEGTGITPGVPNESTVIFTTSSDGTGTILGVLNEVKGASEAKAISVIDWGSENKSDYPTKSDEIKGVEKEKNYKEEIEWVSTDEEDEQQDDQDNDNDKSIDIEKNDDEEETDDGRVHGVEYVHVDEELKDVEVAETGKDDEEISDAAKANAEKTIEVKDDQVKDDSAQDNHAAIFFYNTGKAPVCLYRDQFTVGHLNPTSIPHIQSPSILTVHVLVIPEPTVLSPIPEIPIVTPIKTLPPPPSITNITPVLQQQTTPIPTPSITAATPAATTVPDPLPTIVQRVSELEKMFKSSNKDALQKVLQKHTEELIQQSSQKDVSEIFKIKKEQVEKQQMPEYSVKSSDKATLDEYDQKRVADSPKKKRQHDDQDKDPSAGPNQGEKTKRRRTKEYASSKNSSTSKGNTPPKTSKFDKHVHAKESVVEPTEEVIMDAANDNVVNDADQLQDESEPKTNREPRNDWFTQPPRPPTLDLEWNKGKEVDDGQEQT
ncbi:hypothetical protein Tco_0640172 [Tanacetum coccineum]